MNVTVRLINVEGVTIKEYQQDMPSRLERVILVPAYNRFSMNIKTVDPTAAPEIYYIEFRIFTFLSEEDGGPLAVYKQKLGFRA